MCYSFTCIHVIHSHVLYMLIFMYILNIFYYSTVGWSCSFVPKHVSYCMEDLLKVCTSWLGYPFHLEKELKSLTLSINGNYSSSSSDLLSGQLILPPFGGCLSTWISWLRVRQCFEGIPQVKPSILEKLTIILRFFVFKSCLFFGCTNHLLVLLWLIVFPKYVKMACRRFKQLEEFNLTCYRWREQWWGQWSGWGYPWNGWEVARWWSTQPRCASYFVLVPFEEVHLYTYLFNIFRIRPSSRVYINGNSMFLTYFEFFGVCFLYGVGGDFGFESVCRQYGLLCTWLINLKKVVLLCKYGTIHFGVVKCWINVVKEFVLCCE